MLGERIDSRAWSNLLGKYAAAIEIKAESKIDVYVNTRFDSLCSFQPTENLTLISALKGCPLIFGPAPKILIHTLLFGCTSTAPRPLFIPPRQCRTVDSDRDEPPSSHLHPVRSATAVPQGLPPESIPRRRVSSPAHPPEVRSQHRGRSHT